MVLLGQALVEAQEQNQVAPKPPTSKRPPIPIPLWLPRTPATELHYRAISAFLGKHPNAGRLMLQAISDVIKAAIDSWTQLEVFYYWVKMRSLLAETHKQNYQLYGRLEGLPPPRSR